jgi:hypothetical protein
MPKSSAINCLRRLGDVNKRPEERRRTRQLRKGKQPSSVHKGVKSRSKVKRIPFSVPPLFSPRFSRFYKDCTYPGNPSSKIPTHPRRRGCQGDADVRYSQRRLLLSHPPPDERLPPPAARPYSAFPSRRRRPAQPPPAPPAPPPSDPSLPLPPAQPRRRPRQTPRRPAAPSSSIGKHERVKSGGSRGTRRYRPTTTAPNSQYKEQNGI